MPEMHDAASNQVSDRGTEGTIRTEDEIPKPAETPEEKRFADLTRQLNVTSRCAFRASGRLSLHKLLAEASVTFLSIGLIIVPTLLLGGVPSELPKGLTEALQICAAVAILSFSLHLNGSDFATRLLKHHQCGLELRELLRKLKPPNSPQGTIKHYDEFSERYAKVLEKYDNHEAIDYENVELEKLIRQKDSLGRLPKNELNVMTAKLWVKRIAVWGRTLAQFVPYVSAWVAMVIWILITFCPFFSPIKG
jgi:SMODS and SLOG-associating 2TM effector domain family 5